MDELARNGSYPRPLGKREREWIKWILPDDRPGYHEYHRMIDTMSVIGEGRRGAGEIILGGENDRPDFGAPLAPVFAYGAIETDMGTISITLREILGNQISVEIVSQRSESVPAVYEESRRWTYSAWNPGNPCPQCGAGVREVPMLAQESGTVSFVLAFCRADRRLWVHDAASGVTRPIPLTNFYNELMLLKNIREPAVALDARRLFVDLDRYSDEELVKAFLAYNRLKAKVRIDGPVEPAQSERPGILRSVWNFFSKRRV